MTSAELVTVISALAVALVSVITAWRTTAKVEHLEKVAEKTADKAEVKLDKIHELTNSNLTAVKTALSVANDRIVKLEAVLGPVVAATALGPAASAKVADPSKEKE